MLVPSCYNESAAAVKNEVQILKSLLLAGQLFPGSLLRTQRLDPVTYFYQTDLSLNPRTSSEQAPWTRNAHRTLIGGVCSNVHPQASYPRICKVGGENMDVNPSLTLAVVYLMLDNSEKWGDKWAKQLHSHVQVNPAF